MGEKAIKVLISSQFFGNMFRLWLRLLETQLNDDHLGRRWWSGVAWQSSRLATRRDDRPWDQITDCRQRSPLNLGFLAFSGWLSHKPATLGIIRTHYRTLNSIGWVVDAGN